MLFSVANSLPTNITASICAASGADPVIAFFDSGRIDDYLDTFRVVPEDGSVIVPIVRSNTQEPVLDGLELNTAHVNTFINQSRLMMRIMGNEMIRDLAEPDIEEANSEHWAMRRLTFDPHSITCYQDSDIAGYQGPTMSEVKRRIEFVYPEARDDPHELRILSESEESRTSTIIIKCENDFVSFRSYEIEFGGVALYRLLTETLGLASDCSLTEGACRLYRYMGATERINWEDGKFSKTSSNVVFQDAPFIMYASERHGYRWDPRRSMLTIHYHMQGEKRFALDPRLLEFWTY